MSLATIGADKVPFIDISLHRLGSLAYIQLKFSKLIFCFIILVADWIKVNNWTVDLFIVNYFYNFVLTIGCDAVTDLTVSRNILSLVRWGDEEILWNGRFIDTKVYLIDDVETYDINKLLQWNSSLVLWFCSVSAFKLKLYFKYLPFVKRNQYLIRTSIN